MQPSWNRPPSGPWGGKCGFRRRGLRRRGPPPAAAGITLPADYRVSIVNADGDTTYPIASFTYLLVRKDAASCATAKPLVNMLWWTFHDPSATKTASDLNYAPVPAKALEPIEKTLQSLKCEGKVILPGS